jgi:hypothetical protein
LKRWDELEAEAGELARAGRRLLGGADGLPIGFLATADARGRPHLAPVCPIFAERSLYLSASGGSPKVRDLRENGRFSLHAFLGDGDEEFQILGSAREVTAPEERERVHEAIPFGGFDRTHPVFELRIARALWVAWENFGQPDTRAVRRRWPAVEDGT